MQNIQLKNVFTNRFISRRLVRCEFHSKLRGILTMTGMYTNYMYFILFFSLPIYCIYPLIACKSKYLQS